jgi:hypothetical protein
MWTKIWQFIKSGRLGEPSTYSGIAAIVVPIYALAGRPLMTDTGEAITPDMLTQMLSSPIGGIALGVMGIAGLIAIFTREKKPPA